MHEMGITQGILSASVEAAESAGASRIVAIDVSVGELTEIVETALHFAFDALSPGTIAEGAVLRVTMVAPRSHCTECGTDYDHDRFEMLCPACGSFLVTPIAGRELRIDSIETADEHDAGMRTADGTQPATGTDTTTGTPDTTTGTQG